MVKIVFKCGIDYCLNSLSVDIPFGNAKSGAEIMTNILITSGWLRHFDGYFTCSYCMEMMRTDEQVMYRSRKQVALDISCPECSETSRIITLVPPKYRRASARINRVWPVHGKFNNLTEMTVSAINSYPEDFEKFLSDAFEKFMDEYAIFFPNLTLEGGQEVCYLHE